MATSRLASRLLALASASCACALMPAAARAAPPQPLRPLGLARLRMLLPPPDEEPADKDKEYSVDWDGAWQLELNRRQAGAQRWRPEGREPVTEEVLLRARVATASDTAQAQVQTWTRDWRFWMGIIAVLSVGSAIATNMNGGQAAYMV